ncbi:MAG: DUF2066 domain-containing protein [Gammaproteobacteria bacterium]|nr:DUF2066 domain-containing protein [Gammaproteobacteria bacterium]
MKNRIFILLALVFLNASASARTVNDLYDTLAPVEGRGEKAYQKALEQALAQVLVKVSGTRSALVSPALQEQLPQAKEMVERFEYRGGTASPGTAKTPLSLAVRFQAVKVEKFMRANGIPIWSKNRPFVLAWIVFENRGLQVLVNQEENAEVYGLLAARANQRGLPLLFPLLDIDDRRNLSPSQVQNGTHAVIKQASERYAPDVILAGNVYRAGKLWEAQWYLYLGEENLTWSGRRGVLKAVLDEGIDTFTDSVAARFTAQTEAASAEFGLIVEAVSKLEDYTRVQKYLRSLDAVTDLQILQVESDRLHLSVQAKGGSAGLAQAVRFEQVLTLQHETQGTAVYRLLP